MSLRPHWLPRAALGLGLAGGALWASTRLMTQAATRAPVTVTTAGGASAGEQGSWRAEAGPPEELERLEVLLDDALQEDAAAGPSGQVELSLEGLAPGYHRVELRTRRRGGRVHSVTSAVLVGPFADREEPPDAQRCGASVQISAEALKRVLLPVVRARLLSATRDTELLGPSTRLERFEITLIEGGARFDIALAGQNRVAAAGELSLRVPTLGRLELELVSLAAVSFTGELRTKATVGGAAVGAVITGPLAPLGALAGYIAVERYIEGRAHDEVQARVEQALKKISAAPLLPERVTLIPGEPRAEVELALCEPARLDPTLGASLRLSITPALDPSELRQLAAPGPVDHGVTLPAPARLPSGTDVQVDMSIDTLNRLLELWTAAGVLEERVASAGLLARANETLAEWTTLQLERLAPRLPPALGLPGETDEDGAWSISIGDLELGLTGVDTARFSAVTIGGLGRVWPHYDEERGELRLAAELEKIWLSCERQGAAAIAVAPGEPATLPAVVREPCFGALLEVATFSEQLNAALAPGAARLPGLDVRGLLQRKTERLRPGGLELERLWSEHPEGAPGVLRIRGAVR